MRRIWSEENRTAYLQIEASLNPGAGPFHFGYVRPIVDRCESMVRLQTASIRLKRGPHSITPEQRAETEQP